MKSLYRFWAETDQSIFFVESEEVAVADHFISSTLIHETYSRVKQLLNPNYSPESITFFPVNRSFILDVRKPKFAITVPRNGTARSLERMLVPLTE